MDVVADIGGTNARFACYTADPSRQSAGKISIRHAISVLIFPAWQMR